MKNKLSVIGKDVVDVGTTIVKKQKVTIEFQDGKIYVHEDIKGYSVNGPYFIVQEHDDTQYIFPMANVNFIKITVNTVEE